MKTTSEQIILAIVAICLLVISTVWGLAGVEAQQQRPYSMFELRWNTGRSQCIYVFGTQFGVTAVITPVASFNDCPTLTQK